MQSIDLPWGRFFSAAPALPEPSRGPEPSGPQPAPEGPKKPRSWGLWGLVVGLLIGFAAYQLSDKIEMAGRSGGPSASTRTATVAAGELIDTLRVAGSVRAKNEVSIRAPQMRGPRDAGRQQLTLMSLVEPGATVRAGDTVAEFELKWLEDHIDDRRSAYVQSLADVDKRRAENMIEAETDRQAVITAKAEYEKALLDLRTAEVKSDIEAEILKNLAEQTKATWEELAEEAELRKTVHEADINVMKATAQGDKLHLERHQRDYDRLNLTTPLGGLVVMEPQYKGGGQFAQTEEGDQVYPGALFMRVVDLSEMIVEVEVNQVDIQSVRIGQPAEVRLDAYPGVVLEGEVAGVGAIAGEGGGGRFRRGGSGLYLKTVPVQITIHTSDERVIPDLSASADIQIREPIEGLVAPREAVRVEDGETVVYVRRGDGFAPRPVELGEKNATQVIVESGVEAGEEVLLNKRLLASN